MKGRLALEQEIPTPVPKQNPIIINDNQDSDQNHYKLDPAAKSQPAESHNQTQAADSDNQAADCDNQAQAADSEPQNQHVPLAELWKNRVPNSSFQTIYYEGNWYTSWVEDKVFRGRAATRGEISLIIPFPPDNNEIIRGQTESIILASME